MPTEAEKNEDCQRDIASHDAMDAPPARSDISAPKTVLKAFLNSDKKTK